MGDLDPKPVGAQTRTAPVSFEFGGAGVHEPVAGDKSELLAFSAEGVLGPAGQMGDLPVGKTERLRFGEQFWDRAC